MSLAATTRKVQIGRHRLALTQNDRDVVGLIMDGLGYKQVAAEHGVSEKTIRTRMQRIYARLGVGCTAHLVIMGLKLGIRRLDDYTE